MAVHSAFAIQTLKQLDASEGFNVKAGAVLVAFHIFGRAYLARPSLNGENIELMF